MGRCIIKLSEGDRDWYLEWSTVVDAPVTYGMTLEQLRERVREKYGSDGVDELPERLERVEKCGTSMWRDESVITSRGRRRRASPWKRRARGGHGNDARSDRAASVAACVLGTPSGAWRHEPSGYAGSHAIRAARLVGLDARRSDVAAQVRGGGPMTRTWRYCERPMSPTTWPVPHAPLCKGMRWVFRGLSPQRHIPCPTCNASGLEGER